MFNMEPLQHFARSHIYLLGSAVVVLGLLIHSNLRRRRQRKIEEEFAIEHGCKPLRPWVARWPLGLDFLVKIVWHVRHKSVLRFFTESWDLCPMTHEQKMCKAHPCGLADAEVSDFQVFDTGIATIDPENVEAMLSSQFHDFNLGLRSAQFKDLFGTGFFCQEGAAWKHPRNLIRPQLTSNRQQNFEFVKESVGNLVHQLPRDGVVDLQPLFLDLALDTTLFLLFGDVARKVRDNSDVTSRREFAAAFSDGQEYLTFRVRLGPLYYLINSPHYWKTCRTVRGFMDGLVKQALGPVMERKAWSPKEYSAHAIFDAIAESSQDVRFLSDQCLSALLAGRDSVASCLSWTMYLLVRHPRCLDELCAEIASTIGSEREDDSPTPEDLKHMPYLDCVIKESLRLYPPIPVNVRSASRLTTLPVGGGEDGKAPVMVRKGQAITWSSYVMHRRKDIFGPDARDFRPERWANDAFRDVEYAYSPFSGGPRHCLGQDFAMLEVGYTIVRLLQRFEIMLPAGVRDPPELGHEKQLMGLILSPAEGCLVHARAIGE